VPDDAGHRHRYSLTGPAAPASLDQVHALLEAVWSDCSDVTPADRMLFEIAVIEVAGNIVEHAPDGSPLEFTLHVRVHPDRIEAHFSDTGGRADVNLTDAAAMPPDMSESGRGLAMTLAAVDELLYRRDSNTNHWRIVRRRRAG
jgi:serine/threonine-protein kinase RsbW